MREIDKKVKQKDISLWMHRNARNLEIKIWEYLFEDGSVENIICALKYYQNDDGGFGNGVEPDNWNPNSLPYATSYVIELLGKIKYFDMTSSIYVGLKKYIDNIPSINDFNFVIPSNNDYPHAPWFNYDNNSDSYENIGVVSIFCGFIIEHFKESNKYDEALKKANELVNLLDSDKLGDMGPLGIANLVFAMERSGVLGNDYEVLKNKAVRAVNKIIQRDKSMWKNYGYRPSDVICDKNSIFYKGNEDIVNEELDYLKNTLPENDVWPITWTWFKNMDKYSKEFYVSENYYKAIKAIERFSFLKAFSRTK